MDVISAASFTVSVGGMDLGRGGDVICVRLRQRLHHSTIKLALRETSAMSCKSGYSDTSSSGLFRSGTGPHGRLA